MNVFKPVLSHDMQNVLETLLNVVCLFAFFFLNDSWVILNLLGAGEIRIHISENYLGVIFQIRVMKSVCSGDQSVSKELLRLPYEINHVE